MREYGLNDAVSSFSHYSSTINSLWGIYVVATFTAAGFGISLRTNSTIHWPRSSVSVFSPSRSATCP